MGKGSGLRRCCAVPKIKPMLPFHDCWQGLWSMQPAAGFRIRQYVHVQRLVLVLVCAVVSLVCRAQYSVSRLMFLEGDQMHLQGSDMCVMSTCKLSIEPCCRIRWQSPCDRMPPCKEQQHSPLLGDAPWRPAVAQLSDLGAVAQRDAVAAGGRGSTGEDFSQCAC